MHGGISDVIDPDRDALHNCVKWTKQEDFTSSNEHVSPDDSVEYLAESPGPFILGDDAVFWARAAHLLARVFVLVVMLSVHF